MIIGRKRFNIYLLCATAAFLLCGCHTQKGEEKKELASLRVHLEATADSPSGSVKVPIYRAGPVELNVEKEPFLTENNIASAQVVDVLGGFDLRIQLNQEGTWLLQNYSASNVGKHYAIWTQFGKKSKQTRWLAAPIFSRLIPDGVIEFTPDASREEAEEIARGWNNYAKKNDLNKKW
jgi:hypothetical protein